MSDNVTCNVLLDSNPVSYIMRANSRAWDPVKHKDSLGVDSMGLKMVRNNPNAPTLRELRKKAKKSKELQSSTGARTESAAAMERLENGDDLETAVSKPPDADTIAADNTELLKSMRLEESSVVTESTQDPGSINGTGLTRLPGDDLSEDSVYVSSSYGNRPIPENPIARSDVAKVDSRVYQRAPKPLSLGASSMTLDVAEAWREAKLTEIKATRKVVEIMIDRTAGQKIETVKDSKKARKKHEEMIKNANAAAEAAKRTQHALSVTSDNDDISIESDALTNASGVTMHIMPALGALKLRRIKEETAEAMNTAPGKHRILSVTYGNRLEVIGSIEVIDSTTYEQARELVQPLVRDYLTSTSRANVRDVRMLKQQLTEYKFLDAEGQPVVGDVAHIRTVWSELVYLGDILMFNPQIRLIYPPPSIILTLQLKLVC